MGSEKSDLGFGRPGLGAKRVTTKMSKKLCQ